MGDLITCLPTDKVPPSGPEKEIIRAVFGSCQKRAKKVHWHWKSFLQDFKFYLLAAALFFLFQWSSIRDAICGMSTLFEKSPLLQHSLNTILFFSLLWIFSHARLNCL